MIEARGLDVVTKAYLDDIKAAERVFMVAQQLSNVFNEIDCLQIDVQPIDRLTSFGITGYRLTTSAIEGQYCIEQQGRDPIPYDRSNVGETWVPRAKFRLPFSSGSVRRPSHFEIADIVQRRKASQHQPEQPIGIDVLQVDSAFIEGAFIAATRPPEQSVIVGKDLRKVDLNRFDDNQYSSSGSIDFNTSQRLLQVLENLIASSPSARIPVKPYIQDIEVIVEKAIEPWHSMSDALQGRRQILRVGSNPIGNDKSALIYSKISEIAETGDVKSLALIRMLDDAGRVCSFILADAGKT